MTANPQGAPIAIIGGGAIGSAIAFFLTQMAPQQRVVVVERDPSYARASSALSASSIRQQFSSPINIAISQFGIEFLRDIGTRLQVEGDRPDIGLVEAGYLYLASPAGAASTLFFALHNMLAKANLFLVAGLIWLLAGHYDLRRVGGLYAARPGLAALFLIVAFSLVGVPPSSGFWAKFLLLREIFAQELWLWGGVALAVSLLTLYRNKKKITKKQENTK